MPDDSELTALLARLKSARVLCVGDVMLDRAAFGTLVPDGGAMPVLSVESETRRISGAGRVLRDLAVLGAAASFVSVVGNDDAGREIERLMADEAGAEIHLLVQPDRRTASRSRFVAAGRTLLRADHESAAPLGPYIREDLLRLARELVTTHGAVVISDHGQGVLTEGVALEIIKAAREAGARTVVAAEGGDPIRYRGADLLTATPRELAQATGMPVEDRGAVIAAAGALIDRCALGGLLVSRPGAGMALVEPGGAVFAEPDAADDPGVAVVAAALGAGLPPRAALRVAAAGNRLISTAK